MRTLLPAVLLVSLLAPAAASAQLGHQRVAYARRPLTLPDATLRFDLPLVFTIRDDDGPGDREDWLDFFGGIGAGITRDFELSALVLPVRMAPDTHYAPGNPYHFTLGAPALSLMWRFARGAVEVALRGDFLLPVRHDFGAQIGLPILIHAGDIIRIDTGPYFLVVFDDPTATRFHIPLELAINVTPSVYLGPEMALEIWNGDGVRIPLGFFVGITVRGRSGPVVDFRFFMRSADIDDGMDVWQLGASATIFAYL